MDLTATESHALQLISPFQLLCIINVAIIDQQNVDLIIVLRMAGNPIACSSIVSTEADPEIF